MRSEHVLCVHRHKIEIYNDLALEAASRLRKGQKIAVHGRLRVRRLNKWLALTKATFDIIHYTMGREGLRTWPRSCAHGIDSHSCCCCSMTASGPSCKGFPRAYSDFVLRFQIDQWTDRDSGLPKQRTKVVADQIATVRPYQVSVMSTASWRLLLHSP